MGLLAGRAEEQQPCPPQRRRYSPAGRLLIGATIRPELLLIVAEVLLIAAPLHAEEFLIVAPLRPELLSICIRHTVRISQQSHRPIDIQLHPETLGEPLDGVERDIVQCVQFADDDGLDQLIDADGTTRSLVDLLVVHLVNEVPSKRLLWPVCPERPARGWAVIPYS
jgi:hypothetical protein